MGSFTPTKIAGQEHQHGTQSLATRQQTVLHGGPETGSPAAASHTNTETVLHRTPQCGCVLLEVIAQQ